MPATPGDDPTMDARFIDEYLDYLRAAGAAERTIGAARDVLHRLHRELPAGLCRALPHELVGVLSVRRTAATKATYRAHLRRFFGWAVDGPSPCLDWDPSAGLPRPRVPARLPRPATDEQVTAALRRARPPWRLHCLLAAYAGLRCCEIAALDRADITASDILVHGKGGKQRSIPTDPDVWAAVQDLPPGPVTRRLDGEPADAGWVSRSTGSHLRRYVGVRTSLHRMRSWYATQILEVCGDVMVVKELLGHASVATTQVYTLVRPERLAAAVAGLPRLA